MFLQFSVSILFQGRENPEISFKTLQFRLGGGTVDFLVLSEMICQQTPSSQNILIDDSIKTEDTR